MFPLLGFIEPKTLLIIAHLFGFALGAGTALFSAVMFTKVMYDARITKDEIRFLDTAGLLVTIGLTIIVLSGIGLFFMNQAVYLASTKFLSKMTIVGVLILNGILIHTLHMPLLKKHIEKNLLTVPKFRLRSYFFYIGGAVSMTSWLSAFILGVFRAVPYSYGTIMATYISALVFGIIVAYIVRFLTFGKNTTTHT
ncbi:MAG: hypothetical protein ACJKTH_02005 [Patescibacteria group bacterium UBA2163]